LSPLLHQQFDKLGVLGKESQIGADRHGYPVEWIFDARNARIDLIAKHPHDSVGGGEEDVFLAGEVTVNGAFADAELLGEKLSVRVGIAVLREEPRGRVEDLFSAAGAKSVVNGPPWFLFHCSFHGFSQSRDGRTDQSV